MSNPAPAGENRPAGGCRVTVLTTGGPLNE